MRDPASPSTTDQFKASFPQLAEDLGQPNLDLLLDGASAVEFPAGRKVIRDRMPVEHLYFVLAGTLSAYIEDGGNSRHLAVVGPGQWLGEISVLSGEMVASATVVTDSPCKLLKVHHLTLQKLIVGNETVAKVLLEALIALMAERLRESTTPVLPNEA
jgi:CRP/FNR family cyclic AMP-dependent transcriptional regulator